jgi:hypothetical protein
MAYQTPASGAGQSFCTNCGQHIDSGIQFCPNCGAGTQGGSAPATGTAPPYSSDGPLGGQPSTHVPNYLVQAILVTIFCWLPFGIVAIVYAAQVNGKLAIDDRAGAMRTSASAKTWCWVSFGIGAGLGVLWFFAVACGALHGG